MGRRYKRQRYHPRRLPSIDRLCSPKRMDIYFARLPLHIGSYIIGGERPVIVVSNDIANETAGMVTVIPMTSQAKRMEMPTHILVDEERPSVAMVEQVMTIDKERLINKIGDCREMEGEIMNALERHFSLGRETRATGILKKPHDPKAVYDQRRE